MVSKYSLAWFVLYKSNAQLKGSFSNIISGQPVHLDPESDTLSPSKSSENLADMNYDNPLSSNGNESPDLNPTENANSVVNQISNQNTEHNLQNNDINEKTNIKQYVK